MPNKYVTKVFVNIVTKEIIVEADSKEEAKKKVLRAPLATLMTHADRLSVNLAEDVERTVRSDLPTLT